MRAGEIDYSDGKGYAVPVLGPYSAKFIADAAKKVYAGETEGNPASQQTSAQKEPPYTRPDPEDGQQDAKPVIKRSYPTNFESSDVSIREANKLMTASSSISDKT